MPLHEYRCLECDHDFELLVRANDPAPVCPSCGSDQLERVLSMFAVSSAEQSNRALAQARRAYRASKTREEFQRHQGEIIRDHIQEDYGVDVTRRESKQPSPTADTSPRPKPSGKN